MLVLSILGILLIMVAGIFVPTTIANFLLGCLLVSGGCSAWIWVIFGPLLTVTLAIDINKSANQK